MIKNKEEFKKYNIICTSKKEVYECMSFLEKLGFNVEKVKKLTSCDVIILFEPYANEFRCIACCLNYYKNISFYRFKKLAKKFFKEEEKEKKLEDFEVASDGRIIKVNNWKSDKNVYSINGDCLELSYYNTEGGRNLINLGLLYATKETRDKAQFKLEIETKLKNIAESLNNGEKIDWGNKNQRKHYIYYDLNIKGINDIFVYGAEVKGNIYCLSNKFLDEAKKEIGEENLIKYFKEE